MKLSEGWRTEVFLIRYRGRLAVLKKPKPGMFHLIRREYNVLKYLNEYNVSGIPEAYELSREGLIEEFINGIELRHYEGDLLDIARKALFIAFELDVLGVRHKELSLAHKHVLISGSEVYLIDFGHSELGIHRRSLPQLASYLLIKLRLYEKISVSKETVVRSLKEYKRGNVRPFLSLLDLSPRRLPRLS